MSERTVWQFSDDRGQLSTAGRRPARVLAYVQAGATLWDHGIRPSAIFGSDHDDRTVPDTAKTGSLPTAEVGYLGAGSTLDVDTLLSAEPDLVVAVSYGGGHVYGLAAETAKHLEEHVPVVVIDVGQARGLTEIGDRFAQLARSLGAEEPEVATADLDAARHRLRTLVAAGAGPRVVALSPAGQEQTHLARPRMWPELRALAELGVDIVEPAEDPARTGPRSAGRKRRPCAPRWSSPMSGSTPHRSASCGRTRTGRRSRRPPGWCRGTRSRCAAHGPTHGS